MIDLTAPDKQQVLSILNKHLMRQPVSVFAFGSRAKSMARKYSDLDLALSSSEQIDAMLIAMIKEDFSESDLPFMVDIVDTAKISPEFLAAIKDDFVLLSKYA